MIPFAFKTSNTCVFARGQVWVWVDPIYGRKTHTNHVAPGEGTLRYNRYVLIVQEPKTMQRNVMVVPLSSSKYSPADVEIELIHWPIGKSSTTNTRLCAMFPVNPAQLSKYVCTVSESVMLQVEDGIRSMLLPDDQNLMFNGHLITKRRKSCSLFPSLSGDFDGDIYDGNDDTDDEDIIEPDTSDTDGSDYISTTDIILDGPGSRISEDAVDESHENEQQSGDISEPQSKSGGGRNESTNTKKRSKWTPEVVQEFIDSYENDGIEATADKFKLSKATVQGYYKKWKKSDETSSDSVETSDATPTATEADEHNTNSTEEAVIDTEPLMETIKLFDRSDDETSIKVLLAGMQKFSTVTMSHLREVGIYQRIFRVAKFTSKNTIDNWYEDVQTCINNAIMTFLNFNIDSANNLTQWRFVDGIYRNMVLFLTRIAEDNELAVKRNTFKLINAYRNKYGNDTIHMHFLTFLKGRFVDDMLVDDDRSAENICAEITKMLAN